jgi:hypothetical protein
MQKGQPMQKPGRPLGLSLAIIISVILFSLLPIAQIIFVLSLRQQFQAIEFLPGSGAVGGDLLIADANLIVPFVNGILFLIIAVFAWRGKPQGVRFAFIAGVIYLTAVTILMTVVTVNAEPTVEQGLDSGAQFENSLLGVRVVLSVLVALYVIWYVNRGPARAFYRGYYLSEPVAQTNPQAANQ